MYVGDVVAGNSAGAGAEAGKTVAVAGVVDSTAVASRGAQIPGEVGTVVVGERRWEGSQIFRWVLGVVSGGYRGRVIYERTWVEGRSLGRGASVVGRWWRCAGHRDVL